MFVIERYAPNLRLSELVNKEPERGSSGSFAHLDSLYEKSLQSADLWHGSKIISGSDDDIIRVWDPSTCIKMLSPLRAHDMLINSVALTPGGSKVISGSKDKTIQVWDPSTSAEMLPPLRGHGSEISSVAFSPDGSKIISGSFDDTIRVWNASTGAGMFPSLRGHDDWIRCVAFSPDGIA